MISQPITRLVLALTAVVILATALTNSAQAVAPGNDAFTRTWARTDQPVLDRLTARTWMWGPEANTEIIREPYDESFNGMREVQYYDKARMEITHPDGDASSLWYVTNGLLVVELITGNIQTGDIYEPNNFFPAQINVAGDADDPTGPTYRTFARLLVVDPLAPGTPVIQRVNRTGAVTDDPPLATQGVTAAIVDKRTNHSIASPFWTFMNSNGMVYENGQFVHDQLFENPYFATGRPVTEAYWANVKVGGEYRDVLMQCFERRCLTYTPDNPQGFVVEAGNVGLHYYQWRYGGHEGGSDDGPMPTPSPSPEPMPDTATEYEFLRKWGAKAVDVTLDEPAHLAAAPTGEIYAAVPGRHQILKFAPDGGLLDFWPANSSPGSGQGEFNSPTGVAVDADGLVYVTDYGNHRIQKFDADGTFITAWGAEGAARGNFDGPYGITVGRSGDSVYVTELNNNRVQQFDLIGNYLGSWGSHGTGAGQFSAPHDVAADSSGNVYIADTGNSRIQVFDSDGDPLTSFGPLSNTLGQLVIPVAIDVVPNGDILIADIGTERVEVFAPTPGTAGKVSYEFQTYWGGSGGNGPRDFNNPRGITHDPEGTIYVADSGNGRIQKLDDAGAYLDEWSDGNRSRFAFPVGVEVGPTGRVFVVDHALDNVQVFYPDGAYRDRWGPELSGTTPLKAPRDIAFDANGDAYVVEAERIVKLSSNGDYLGQFSSPGNAIAIDAEGNIYVADSENMRVRKFAPDFSLISAWGVAPTVDVPEFIPEDIAVHGNEVVVLEQYARVSVFDLDGTFLRRWGSGGDGPGQFSGGVSSLAVDPDGYVYVAGGVIQKFAPDGSFIAAIGGPGNGDGQFSVLQGLAVDADFFVYASETDMLGEYARVQVFVPVS